MGFRGRYVPADRIATGRLTVAVDLGTGGLLRAGDVANGARRIELDRTALRLLARDTNGVDTEQVRLGTDGVVRATGRFVADDPGQTGWAELADGGLGLYSGTRPLDWGSTGLLAGTLAHVTARGSALSSGIPVPPFGQQAGPKAAVTVDAGVGNSATVDVYGPTRVTLRTDGGNITVTAGGTVTMSAGLAPKEGPLDLAAGAGLLAGVVAGATAPRYTIDADGWIHLEGGVRDDGAVAGIPAGSTLVTLPATARPTTLRIFTVWASAGAARVDVQAGGNVVLQSVQSASGAFVSLDGIAFRV